MIPKKMFLLSLILLICNCSFGQGISGGTISSLDVLNPKKIRYDCAIINGGVDWSDESLCSEVRGILIGRGLNPVITDDGDEGNYLWVGGWVNPGIGHLEVIYYRDVILKGTEGVHTERAIVWYEDEIVRPSVSGSASEIETPLRYYLVKFIDDYEKVNF